MAYFRGENYIWSDGEHLHFWISDGADNWKDWAFDNGDVPDPENAGGVSVREKLVDEFVMMRLAEILASEDASTIELIIDSAVQVGNFGSDCLNHNADKLKAILTSLQLEKPPPR